MHMIMFVLNDPDKLDELLDAWHEAGIDGATIVESTGIYRRRPHLIGARYTFGFPPLFESSETGNYTLFTIVSDEALIERCIHVTEEIVGDLDIPNSGVFAVWPLSHAKGHAKRTRHNQSEQQEDVRPRESDDETPPERGL